jgi:hypothetical protein
MLLTGRNNLRDNIGLQDNRIVSATKNHDLSYLISVTRKDNLCAAIGKPKVILDNFCGIIDILTYN